MTGTSNKDPWWKHSWPLTRSHWLGLVIALALVIAVGALFGFLLTEWTAPNAVTRADVDLAERLAAHRTQTRTDLATWGAFMANTPVKIGATAIVVLAMLWRWQRWHDALFVALVLIFEATAFITITTIVQRPRPDVVRLLDSPVNSSYPSGHVAAAMVYAAFAVVVYWHTRNRAARLAAILLAAAAPIIVGWARMYQGMHFLSDVVSGMVLGLISLAVCYWILGAPPNAAGSTALPATAITLDLEETTA